MNQRNKEEIKSKEESGKKGRMTTQHAKDRRMCKRNM
jgi:hypothetical protein